MTSLRPLSVVRAAAVVLVAGAVGWTAAAYADTTVSPSRQGDLTIVDINGNYGPLTHGGSATEFSIRPPVTASCPGDSEHDQWRVQSYLVPEGTDIAGIHWQLQGPGVPNGFPLFDWYTHPVSQVLLRRNSVAGQPGLMDAFPPIDFAVFVPGDVAPGSYRLGIACTFFRKTDKYWDTPIIITASTSDKPAGFVWRTAGAADPTVTSGGSRWPLVVGCGLLAILVAGAAVTLRRRHAATDDNVGPDLDAAESGITADAKVPFAHSTSHSTAYSTTYSNSQTTPTSQEDTP